MKGWSMISEIQTSSEIMGREQAAKTVSCPNRGTPVNSTLSLLESILRMGLTSKSPTFNPNIFNSKLDTIIELIRLISKKR